MAKTPRIITPRHYQGIGEIVVTWSRLESHIFKTFEAILKISTMQSLAIFWELGFIGRMDRLDALVALRWRAPKDTRRIEFEGLSDEIRDFYFVRNIAAHSVWRKGSSPEAIRPLYINTKRGIIPKTTHKRFKELEDRDFTAERLHKEALKVYDLAERFKLFSRVHFGAKFLHEDGEERID